MKFKVSEWMVASVFIGATVFLFLTSQPVPEALLVTMGVTLGYSLGHRAANPVPESPEELTRPYIPGGSDES